MKSSIILANAILAEVICFRIHEYTSSERAPTMQARIHRFFLTCNSFRVGDYSIETLENPAELRFNQLIIEDQDNVSKEQAARVR